jgi:signal transduction histidine kinase
MPTTNALTARARAIDSLSADVVLAALLTAAGQVEAFTVEAGGGSRAATAATSLVCTLLVALRRRRPAVAGIGVASTLFLKNALGGFPELVVPLIAGIIVIYSVGAHLDLRRSLWTLGAMLALDIAAVPFSHHRTPGDYVFAGVAFLAPWAAGRAVRARTQRAHSLEQVAETLDREREANARLAVSEERARIARELHDVVAHGVSVMVVQAAGAEEVLRRSPNGEPERAVEAMRSIQAMGRESISELGRLLGVLQSENGHAELEPQPSLAQLDALCGRVRETGLPVTLEVEGGLDGLPAGLDLAAYRIVQEALSNTIKHAGDATAQVHVWRTPASLELEVTDDGGAGAALPNGTGHGIIGMRERAMLYHGELTVGPRPTGGFSVRASLPLPRA